MVASLEYGSPVIQFRCNTPECPGVNMVVVETTAAHHLRGAIPPGHHVLGQLLRSVGVQMHSAAQSKVCDLYLTVSCVHQNVFRFQIPMDDPARVHVLQT